MNEMMLMCFCAAMTIRPEHINFITLERIEQVFYKGDTKEEREDKKGEIQIMVNIGKNIGSMTKSDRMMKNKHQKQDTLTINS